MAESRRGRGHSVALLAILMSACVLVLTPAVVAAISMIDPGVLDHTLSWFQPLSAVQLHLDHAKLLLSAGSVFIVWSDRQDDDVDWSEA